MQCRIYISSGFDKQYLDRTDAKSMDYITAMAYARENASGMPETMIHVEHAITGQDVRTVVNRDGKICESVRLYA